MAHVLVFHHALGLTEGIDAFAGELRAAGHVVDTPDLFDGKTFTSLDDGVAHADAQGFGNLLETGAALASEHPAAVVYAGFSLGALIAHNLAQTRPGALGALLYHYGDVPLTMFGDSWPSGVPVQFHIAEADDWREAGVVEDFVAAVAPVATAELFEYPGSAHLFTDSSLAEFDEESAAAVLERTLRFLDGVGRPR